MIEYKILGIIINNNLFEEKDKYFFHIRSNDCRQIINIINETEKKYQSITKDGLEAYIETEKKQYADLYYRIIDSAHDKESLLQLTRQLQERNTKSDIDLLNKRIQTNPELSHLDVKQLLIEEAEKIIDVEMHKIEDGKNECRWMVEQLQKKEPLKKVYSGIEYFEKFQGGYDQTDIIILAGAPSEGKTSKVIDIIPKQLKKGLKIGFISCEMSRKKLYQLIACNIAGFDTIKFEMQQLTKIETSKFVSVLEKLYDYPLYIDYVSREWNDIKSFIKILKQEKDIDIIYIDYLQRIRVKGLKTMYERLEFVSGAIKDLCIELNIPIFVIASLNNEGINSPYASLTHIKGNGDIGYDADIGIIGKRNKEKEIRHDNIERIIEWHVLKNRNGRQSMIREIFKTPFRRFESYEKKVIYNQERKDIYG